MGVTIIDYQRDGATDHAKDKGCPICKAILGVLAALGLIGLGYFIAVKCGVIEPCCGRTVIVECCEFDFDF